MRLKRYPFHPTDLVTAPLTSFPVPRCLIADLSWPKREATEIYPRVLGSRHHPPVFLPGRCRLVFFFAKKDKTQYLYKLSMFE